ncbi:hypothetical protein JOQ06_019019 [Pogonophryne albipinna]|uniref:Uncharacterized protein n=1 Tax=Pogonophryne albipinna TaxID=1090488 RepID=A0AAD6ARK7_9TELE|nr:hypothetical protein JOQ06_019019 [Pogonophryne albipinna]
MARKGERKKRRTTRRGTKKRVREDPYLNLLREDILYQRGRGEESSRGPRKIVTWDLSHVLHLCKIVMVQWSNSKCGHLVHKRRTPSCSTLTCPSTFMCSMWLVVLPQGGVFSR